MDDILNLTGEAPQKKTVVEQDIFGMAPPAATQSSPPAADDIFGAAPNTASQPPPAAIPLAAPVATSAPEVNALREWEKAHEAELEKLAQKEIEAKKKVRAEAQQELQKWYEDRKVRIEKAKAMNRKEQAEWEKIRDANNASGGANPWEKVASLIEERRPEVQEKPVTPRKPDPCTSTARMKTLLISCKTKPPA